MTESYSRTANLLGALALAVADLIREATEGPADGLAASEPAALVTLAHYPGQSILSLGRTLGLTHSGAVRLADRMEQAGLVRRAAAGPGRTLALSLTGPGQAAADRVLARRQAAVEDLVSRLDATELAGADRMASRLLAGLTTDRDSARRLCRLCAEPVCTGPAGCPVDQAAGA
jgi:MarR family transcriptional regulator, negative regulator of the multidrug operon emrRAB